MAGELVYLEAIVGADITSFRRGMAQVRSEITQTAGLSSSLMGLGSALTLGLSVPIAALTGVGLKMFASFDEGMRNVNSIANLSESEFKKLSDAVKEVGDYMWGGPVEASKALYEVYSAGFGGSPEEAIEVMTVALRAAEAGLADAASVTRFLTSALIAYGEGADKATYYSDILTRAVQVGIGSMDEFRSGMSNTVATAVTLGVSFEELGYNVAFFTQRGMSADEAGTALNGMLKKLLVPTDAMKAAFEQLGVATGTELIQKFGGLQGAMKALGELFGYDAEQMTDLFNEVRAFRGAASIFNNFEGWATGMKSFSDAVPNATLRAFEEQSKSLESQLKRTWAGFQTFFINLGQAAAEVLTPVFKLFNDISISLANLDEETLKNVVTFALLAAAIGPIIWIVGALLSPFGLLAMAIGAIGVAIKENFLGVATFLGDAWMRIKFFAEGVYNALMGGPQSAYNAVSMFMEAGMSRENAIKFEKFFHDLGESVRYFVAGFEVNINDAVFKLQYFVGTVGETIQALADQDWGIAFRGLTKELEKPQLTGANNLFQQPFNEMLNTVNQASKHEAWDNLGKQITTVGELLIFYLGAIGAASIATFITGTLIPAITSIITLALSPLGVALIVGSLLILAYQNNWLGFRDAINNFVIPAVNDMLRVLRDSVVRFAQLHVVLKNFLEGADKAKEVYDWYAGMGVWNWGADMMANPTQSPTQALADQFPDFGKPPLPPYSGPYQPGFMPSGKASPQVSPKSLAEASGYGTQNNTINVYTNDADKLLSKLRAQGIDLKASKRG